MWKWIVEQPATYRLLPDYFRTVAGRWLEALFGTSPFAIAFLLWWILGNPPQRIIAIVCVIAFFFASYHAWRIEHEQADTQSLREALGPFFAIAIAMGSGILQDLHLAQTAADLDAAKERLEEWRRLVNQELYAVNHPIEAAIFSQAADNAMERVTTAEPESIEKEFHLSRAQLHQDALVKIAAEAK